MIRPSQNRVVLFSDSRLYLVADSVFLFSSFGIFSKFPGGYPRIHVWILTFCTYMDSKFHIQPSVSPHPFHMFLS